MILIERVHVFLVIGNLCTKMMAKIAVFLFLLTIFCCLQQTSSQTTTEDPAATTADATTADPTTAEVTTAEDESTTVDPSNAYYYGEDYGTAGDYGGGSGADYYGDQDEGDSDYNENTAGDYEYSNQDAESLAVLSNSANLTAKNDKCDALIFKNLRRRSEVKDTQPRIPINLDVKVIVISLNDISDVTGTVSLIARIDIRWTDHRLALGTNNRKSCSGETLLVKTTELWFPYFLIQNGASTIFYPDSFEKYPSILRADGRVSWRMAFPLDLACDLNVSLFPFDRQLCAILIQSPHFGNGELNYTSSNPDRAVIMLNAEDADHPMWEIKGQGLQYTRRVPGIKFWIEYRRKYMYYVYTIAIPLLSVFVQTATTFVLPANYGEKLSTAVAGLMSYFFVFLLFVDSTPVTSTEIPALLIFFAFQIILSFLTVLVSAVIGRMVCWENREEEEEQEKMREAVDASKQVIPEVKRIYSSIFNRTAMKGNHQLSKAGKAATQGSGVSKKAIDGVVKQLKKRLIHSEALNDICLLLYTAFVFCSIIVLVAYIGVRYRTAEDQFPVQTAPINEFKPDLDAW